MEVVNFGLQFVLLSDRDCIPLYSGKYLKDTNPNLRKLFNLSCRIMLFILVDPDQNVLPTMGFHIVTLKHKSYLVKIYDIGGSSQIRALWPKYYNDVSNFRVYFPNGRQVVIIQVAVIKYNQ